MPYRPNDPSVPVPNYTPPWEADHIRLRLGRDFELGWIFIDESREATSFLYEISEPSRWNPDHVAPHPVYVGITDSFPERWAAHRRKSWWFERINPLCVQLTGFETREDARKAEALAIREHRPAYNTKEELRWAQIADDSPPGYDVFTAEIHYRRRHGA